MDFERVFNESYERVLKEQRDRQGLFQAFYRRFVSADPHVAEMFRHSDIEQQSQQLEKSFYRLVVFYATNYADDYLQQIALRHSKCGLDVKPHYYDLWLDTLVDTVSDFDPFFDDNVELAWRLVLSTGLTYMKFKYDH